ncbi:hypothetical protein CV102_00765 [Natronococcus pandeyae]|uniref:Uncharacterized protein n=1 Tax=Natronococcus pandeyae TaxID=2055836 RepID=A0A8J8Q4F3_9EURY|nr:hypothetical protein [Natronococcus pandeyae]TYL40145.1 hypothetical protein CV102_00765 [Natronococcus pandeyae]
MTDRSEAIERLARPEYTGENRCLPCTMVNVTIAIGLAIGLAVAVSGTVGALAFVAFLAVIYLRGYLIPGTPALTRRYLPRRILEWFGKLSDQRPTIETADLEPAVDALSTASVVSRQGNELELTREFRDRWRDRIESESGETALPNAAAVAAMFDADEVELRGDATVEIDGRRLVRWPSVTALAADVAADRELRGELEGWTDLDPDDRRDVLTGLRLLAERCPACDGRLVRDVERLEHCCRRPHVALEVDCEECGQPITSLAVPESSPLLEWAPEDVADA